MNPKISNFRMARLCELDQRKTIQIESWVPIKYNTFFFLDNLVSILSILDVYFVPKTTWKS